MKVILPFIEQLNIGEVPPVIWETGTPTAMPTAMPTAKPTAMPTATPKMSKTPKTPKMPVKQESQKNIQKS